MHRHHLLDLLQRYRAAWPGEGGMVDRLATLVQGHADCFERTCIPGHVTASSWIVSADGHQHLLTLHRKLGRWLQLGGHSDGDPDPLSVALREAREESGLQRLAPHPAWTGPVPFDVDVHLIPARGSEPAHEHHDVRYLLVAQPGQTVVCSDESHEVRWFTDAELGAVTDEESVLRMLRKCRRVLGLAAGGVKTLGRTLTVLVLVVAGAGSVGVVEGVLDIQGSDQPSVRWRAADLLGYAALTWIASALACVLPALVVSALFGRWGSVTGGAGVGCGLWVALVLLLDGRGVLLVLLAGLLAALAATLTFNLLLRRRPARRALGALAGAGLSWVVAALAVGWDVALPTGSAGPAPTDGPRGLVVVVADALRADALSCYGGPRPTPHIDRLGAEGWRVDDVLSSSSWTLPAVASLWTAEPPRGHGVSSYAAVLPDDVPVLAEHVAREGWLTAAVVSNALLEPSRGFGRGFDLFWCDTRQTEASLFWILRANRWARAQGLLTGPNVGAKLVLPTWSPWAGTGARRAGYLAADAVTDRALSVLDAVGAAPFLLYVHYFDPHDPYLPHPSEVLFDEPLFAEAHRERLDELYAGEVAFLDEQVGRLTEGLAERGLLDDVVVAFTADHGEEFHDHGGWRHGGTLYDELVRLPLLVRFPGGVAPRPAPPTASLADVAPTLLGAAALPPLPGARGRNLLAEQPAAVRFAERIQGRVWIVAVRTGERHWIARLPGDLLPTADELARWRGRLEQPVPPLVRWTLDDDQPLRVPAAAGGAWSYVDGAGPDGSRALRLEAIGAATQGTPAARSRVWRLEQDGVVSVALWVAADAPGATLRLFLEQRSETGWAVVEGSERRVAAAAGPMRVVTPARRVVAGRDLRLVVLPTRPLASGASWVVDDVVVAVDEPRLVFAGEVFDVANDPGQKRDLFRFDDPGWPKVLGLILSYVAESRGDSQRPLDPDELERLRAMGYLR